MTGLTLSHFFKNNDKLETRLSYSGNASDYVFDGRNSSTGDVFGDSDILRNSALRISADYTKKFNAKMTLNTGIIGSFMNYDVLTTETFNNQTYDVMKEDGGGTMGQGYIQAKYRFSNAVSSTFGVHGTYFSVNEDLTIEPRLGLEWKVNQNSFEKNAFESIFYSNRKHNSKY